MEQGICNQQMSDRNHIHLKNRAKLTFRFDQHNVCTPMYCRFVDNIILFRYENKVQPKKIVFSTSEPNITWKKYDFYSVFISTLST